MPACAHAMRRTRESDGATICCDCGKVFKPKKAKASDPPPCPYAGLYDRGECCGGGCLGKPDPT